MDKMAYYWKAERVMKIGILTLHSQVNYGGVLQAYALQEVLKGLGHDVVVIDRWMDEYNATLRGITASRSISGWVKFIGRALLGFGDGADYIRHVRTAKILPSLLKLTPYHFYHWEDAPNDLGVDVIIVGSDQVWNPSLQGRELPYLLENAPLVPAISYAASFGVPTISDELSERYKDGFKRFSAISVREEQGARIVESLGGHAVHVLDPTLLADISVWNRFVGRNEFNGNRRLFCYLIQDPRGFVVEDLRRFAKEQDCDVEIFFGGPCALLPSSLSDFCRIFTGPIRANLSPNIHTCAMATPDEFVRGISNADWIVTDSFHAVMLSTIFKKNVRVLRPRNGRGSAGFARLEEFISENITTPIMCNDYHDAFMSFYAGESIAYSDELLKSRKKASLSWLKTALDNIND